MSMANRTILVEIESGSDTSPAFAYGGGFPRGLVMPSAFDGATISFLGSNERDGTFVPVYDDAGAQVSVAVAAGRYIALNKSSLMGIPWIKIMAASSQSAKRSLFLCMSDAWAG
jgi:hypothetical protein